MAEQGESDDDPPEAEDKTEEPSQRRLDQAREQGNLPISREAVSFATLLLTTGACLMMLPQAARDAMTAMRGLLSRSHEWTAEAAARAMLGEFLSIAAPIIGAALVAAVVATMAQSRGAIVESALEPKPGRLNPMAALGRMFGAEGLLEFGKTLLKLLVVGGAVAWAAWDLSRLGATLHHNGQGTLEAIGRGARSLAFTTLAAFALLAGGDVLLTRLRWKKNLRMTREEAKKEAKETEGNPEIKGRQRQIQMAAARRRMIAAVREATVVITNPTHYAVALSYDPMKSAAPKLVAKGADLMAARIREVAEEARVPIIQNPPVARALFKLPDDTEIPAEHWGVVAEIIAFVFRRKGGAPTG
jgi:flagellar biosynthetic protein FlhB